MIVNERNAKEWIDRFLDGATTCAEEKELYRFFNEGNIPEELKKYQQMFQWYADGMPGDPRPQKTKVVNLVQISMKVAASIVLVCGLGLGMYQIAFQKKYEFLEGSYIIRDGRKVTDLKSILPELRKMNKLAAQQEIEIEAIDNFDVDRYIEKMESDPTNESDNLPII